MSTMSKTLLAVLVGILVGGAAYVMAAPADKSSSTATTPAAATTSTTGNVDVSGPCDEAEHANDPRCVGPQRPEDNETVRPPRPTPARATSAGRAMRPSTRTIRAAPVPAGTSSTSTTRGPARTTRGPAMPGTVAMTDPTTMSATTMAGTAAMTVPATW
jgi:hypothetical protein